MRDPALGCVEICGVSSASADLVANQVKLAWFTWYPLPPSKVIVDRGRKFFAQFKMRDNYDIKVRHITIHSPQADAILERMMAY